MYEAIILAGGLGTRLRSVVSEVPKVVAPVAGKPFLHYIITKLINENVTRIILAEGTSMKLLKIIFPNPIIKQNLFSVSRTNP